MSNLVQVYNKPHKSRQREACFGAALVASLDATLVPRNFDLRPDVVKRPINVRELESWLAADHYLPSAKRQSCIEILQRLPDQLLVALDPSRISFDFVVVRGAEEFYLEFHEQQHFKLTVDRPHAIYDLSGAEHIVPRFVQRFVRDVWRAVHFPNYIIVWHDWFKQHGISPLLPLSSGFYEHHLPGTFSFAAFCKGVERGA